MQRKVLLKKRLIANQREEVVYYISAQILNDLSTFDFDGSSLEKYCIQCPHNKIAYSETALTGISKETRDLLESWHPDLPILSSDFGFCEQCVTNTAILDGFNEAMTREKTLLSRALKSNEFFLQNNPEAAFLVCADFMQELRRFHRTPHRVARPSLIDNASLFCEHALLMFDPNINDDANAFEWLTSDEWTLLASNHSFSAEILVSNSGYDVCTECRRQRLLSYHETTVFLEFLDSASSTEINIAHLKCTPRSRKPRHITIQADDTLTEIKSKILRKYHLSPAVQEIEFNDTPLLGNGMTVRDFGILPASTLTVRILHFEDNPVISVEGFKGSLLHH